MTVFVFFTSLWHWCSPCREEVTNLCSHRQEPQVDHTSRVTGQEGIIVLEVMRPDVSNNYLRLL